MVAALSLACAMQSRAETLIDVAFTGASVTSKTGLAATGISSNDFWNACYESAPNLLFVNGVTASGAGLTVAGAPAEYGNGASDPMYGVYLYTTKRNMVATVTNLPPATYDFYLYGHGNYDDDNGIYQVSAGPVNYGTEATTNGSNWLSPIWQEGVQYVEFTNVIVFAGETVTINAEPGAGGMAVLSGLQMVYVAAAPPNPLILVQPTNQDIVAGSTATFSVFANGAMPLAYQWELDNSDIPSATDSSLSITNAQPSNDRSYSVVVSNADGTTTSASAVLTVNGAPFLKTQLTNHTDISGSTVSLSILAGGALPLEYLWLFNGTNILGATNATYTIIGAAPSESGDYSVVVTNAYGSVTSVVANLNVLPVHTTFLDIAFTAASPTSKTGLAAAGLMTTDFWNTCSLSTQSAPDLTYVDGAESSISVAFGTPSLEIASGQNGASDPMYGTYVYPLSGGYPSGEDIYVVITGLMPGAYSFYLYGHGSVSNQNSVFQVFTASRSYASEATTNGADWKSSVWQEGVQFVEFTNLAISAGESTNYPNISVAANQTVITVGPGASGVGFLSGLQIEYIDPTNSTPYIAVQPTNQTVAPGSIATLSVLAGGAPPLTYQWFRNGTEISGATDSGYAVSNAQSTNAGNYWVVITNAYGSFASTVVPLNVVAPVSKVIDVDIVVGTSSKTGFAATGVTSNDYWNAFPPNSGVLNNMEFMDGTPSGAGVTVPWGLQNYYNGASDPMYGPYVYAGGDNIPVTITNLAPGTYDFYLYGHGNANAYNSVFQMDVSYLSYGNEATTNGPGWLSSTWKEGVQYVEFTNVSVDAGQTVMITVEPGAGGYAVLSGLQIVPVGPPSPRAAIVTQPVSEIVEETSSPTFSVVAAGTAPLEYQWSFNGAAISGATNSAYVVTNAQLINDGNYSVLVSNAYGAVTSVMGSLTVSEPVGALIDVAFAQSIATSKTGFAATGVANNDFWNTYSSLANMVLDATITQPNLAFSDGVVSPVELNVTMIDSAVSGVNGASDPMYGVYLHGDFLGGGAVEVTDLSQGIYDFYLYGHGSQDDENTVFQLSVGSVGYGSKVTTTNSCWNSSVWQEGVQYVEFANVIVSNGQDINITFEPGASQYFGVVSGMQIAYVGQAAIVAQPADQPALPGSTATFSVGAIGASPLAYQWLFDNTAIPTATSQSFIVTNAQTYDAGSYSVIVSNAYGSVTSSVAMLIFVDLPTIISPPTSQEVFQGSSAIFSVEAIGLTPLSYQWQFNATNIIGATNSNYALTNAGADNAGNYSVIVSNSYGSVASAVATLNIVQPFAKLIDVAFTAASLTGKRGFAAIGLTGNDFWNTCDTSSAALPNLQFVDGTESGAGLTLTSAQAPGFSANGAPDPMYGVYVSTYTGDIFVTVTNLPAGTYDLYLYGRAGGNDNSIFYLTVGSQSYGSEATTNGSDWLSPVWQEGSQYVKFTNVIVATNQSTTITVGGSTALSGLQAALIHPPALNAFIVSQPTDQTVTLNSPAIFSVLAGGAPPLAYQWLLNGADISVATNTSYSLAHAQPTDAGDYSVIVSNAYGSITSTVATLTVTAPIITLIDVAFTSAAATGKTGFAAVGLSTNDFWNTYKAEDQVLVYANGVTSDAEMSVSNTGLTFDAYGNGASDPMYGIYVYLIPPGGSFTLTVTGLTAGTYDFYCYGHGNVDSQAGVFQITSDSQSYGTQETTTNAGWLSSVWQEGVQYVEFTNVDVTDRQTIAVTVEPDVAGYAVLSGLQMALLGAPPPIIITQPANQTALPGATASFDVLASGATPLAFQWLFNNVSISTATNSSFSVINAQLTNAGSYSVIVTNAYGSITSAVASLTVQTIVTLIDVAFTGASVTTKTGFAATGLTTNDFWNTYVINSGALLNLTLANGTSSGIGLTVSDVAGYYGNGSSDPMYDGYLYSASGGYITVTTTNLISGPYDFYLYGHGNVESENSLFELTVGPTSYGGKTTTNGPGWLSPVWQEGVQYVEFPSVTVAAGQMITITVAPGANGDAVISGLQIADAGPGFIVSQPANQTVLQGSTATFNVVAIGAMPLAYQWLVDNIPIPAATNSSYLIANAQSVDAGNYSVIVTNSYGGATSSVVTLTVVAPLITGIARVANGNVTLNFEGLPNSTVTIWTATNLSPPVFWEPIFTNYSVGTSGEWQFTDTNAVSYDERFYRFSTP